MAVLEYSSREDADDFPDRSASSGVALDADVFVVRVRLDTGAIVHPCCIPYVESSNGEAIAEASAYYSRIFAGKGIVSEVLFEASLNDAGVKTPASVVKWGDLKEQLNLEFLALLERKNVSPEALAEISTSLQVEKNRARFASLVEQSAFSPDAKQEICAALTVASRAHRGVFAARPQDAEGLFHIPYINHPICVATHALRLGLSAAAVQAALLHDVVEDTSWTPEKLQATFQEQVVRLVAALTRPRGQSRADFMVHVASLQGEAQVVKALDRLDNLIRSFGINDRRYIERLLEEDKTVYHRMFRENSTLSSIAETYFMLHNEVAALWGD